jgi:intracellular multiplication protein IcmV
MGVKKVLKDSTIGALNPKRWMSSGLLSKQTSSFKSIVSGTFKSQKEGDGFKPTSFEDCMKHYNVTEDDLKKKMNTASRTSYFCMVLSLVTFFYSFYQFSHTSFLGGVMCVVLTLLLWSLAMREHFNYFQMRERRLGCTFKEWFSSLIKKSS